MHSIHVGLSTSFNELSRSNMADAIRIISSCFSHADCKSDIEHVYSSYADGRRFIHSFHQDVELLRYETLLERNQMVGAGGLYRLPEEAPSALWLGWLGIDPEMRRRGLGTVLLNRLAEIAVGLGAQELKVITPAELPEYGPCRAMYLKAGFQRDPQADVRYIVDGSTYVEWILAKQLVSESDKSNADKIDPMESMRVPPR